MKDLRGIITPLVTPFTKEGHIDEELFRAEVRYVSEAGVHGLSPGGSTGEGAFLTKDELSLLVKITAEENSNHVPIIAGIIKNSTNDAIEAALAAKDAGADALMITPTSYNILVPDDNGNYDFYNKISEAARIPIIIYNVVPQNEISTQLFYKLLDIKNVIGIKQSVNGIKAMYDKKIVCGDKGLIYSATDDMMYSCFELGADGAIAAILTLFPHICMQMWECAKKGDFKTGIKLQNNIYATWQAIIGPHFPRRIKAALKAMGRESGYPRSPIIEATDQEKQEIKSALDNLKNI